FVRAGVSLSAPARASASMPNFPASSRPSALQRRHAATWHASAAIQLSAHSARWVPARARLTGMTALCLRAGLGPEVGPQRFLPVRDGVDLLLAQEDFGVLLELRLEIGRESRAYLHARERFRKRGARHAVALRREERVDDLGNLVRVV